MRTYFRHTTAGMRWRYPMIAGALLALVIGVPVAAQDHGTGGCGDVFGDLIHIQRHAVTGQPILAHRWVELPREEAGYGWGYCPIAVYEADDVLHEISFLPYSCDLDPDFLDKVEEVNYFGRLNGGRTKERNHRMHFSEVISNINAADLVQPSPTGRLMLGFDCNGVGSPPCAEWATIDSPMESMALYGRLMRYGHLGTDPYEVDEWAHGDPKQPTQFHPALTEADWPKFHKTLRHLLPNNGADTASCWDYSAAERYNDANQNGVWDPAEPFIDIDKDGEFDCCSPRPEPFTDLDGDGVWNDAEKFADNNNNGVADAFAFLCAAPELLGNNDFEHGAVWLAAAANKTGKITTDLVQYMNRILKITVETEHSAATLTTLPALYRDCWNSDTDPDDPPDDGAADDPNYLPIDECVVVAADPDETINYELYSDVQEQFVDFSSLNNYTREGAKIKIIRGGEWSGWYTSTEDLKRWVELVNGYDFKNSNMGGFVDSASDALRSIEYIHNYAMPEDLYCVYDLSTCQ